MGPLDPEFFTSDEMRAALTARDIGTVYRLLGRQDVSQRRIAHLTGQSQSEVCEIRQGRRVRDIWVLERIADGLGVPRAWLGLSFGEQAPNPPSAGKERSGAVKRRVLVATASTVAMGQVCVGPPELALPTEHPLPTRLDIAHVHTVAAVTERLRGVARYYGGQADLFSAVATLYTRWMRVPATDVVKARLAAALAELHTEAGWCCYDSGLDGAGFFTHALRLAGTARDTYGIANAAWHAGMTLVRTGHPNDALKLFQLGGFQLRPSADDGRVPTLAARLARASATAYAAMGGLDAALRCLAEANDGCLAKVNERREPRDAFERAGTDLGTAGIHRDLGRLDAAEGFAASAVRVYGEGHYRRGHTVAELLLAEIHVRAGDPQGVTLAHQAIEKVRTLHSIAARRDWLIPLATALQARPGTDTQELARTARQIATSA
ncbi:MAG: helix-turn-helix domain-containing protein [Pseudonocardiaceae bacterium]